CWCWRCCRRRHRESLLFGRFLLAGDRALARSLARARIRVSPLSAHRQSAAMPHSAVAIDLHQPLDVLADVLAQIALDLSLVGYDLTDLPHVVFGQILDPGVPVDPGGVEDVIRARAADAVDVS